MMVPHDEAESGCVKSSTERSAISREASATLLEAAKALVSRDCRFDGRWIVIPCADHAEALRLMINLRAAIYLAEGHS